MGPAEERLIDARRRTLMIILVALFLGPAIFLGVVWGLREGWWGDPLPPDGPPMIGYVLAGLTAVPLILGLLVPSMLIPSQRKRIAAGTWNPLTRHMPTDYYDAYLKQTGDAGRLFLVYQSAAIFSAALVESGALMMAVGYLLDGNPVSLVVGIAILPLILLHFPFKSRIQHWLEYQLQRLDEERRLGESGEVV